MKRLFFIASVLTVFGLSAPTWADDAVDTRERLIDLLDQSNNLSAKFEQRTYKELAAKPDISNGSLKVSKPLKFRWSVFTPFEQEVISNGETLWVFDPDLEQATYQPISQDLQHSPAMILAQPRETLTGQYDVFEVKGDDYIAYKLFPQDEESVFSELIIVFKQNLVSEIQILDSLGQETVIVFTEVTVNQSIADEAFEFSPPPGTDLFEQM